MKVQKEEEVRERIRVKDKSGVDDGKLGALFITGMKWTITKGVEQRLEE